MNEPCEGRYTSVRGETHKRSTFGKTMKNGRNSRMVVVAAAVAVNMMLNTVSTSKHF
jgi:hypothetical protein